MKKLIRFEIFKRDNFTCRYCGKNPPNIILEIDHLIPKSKGGSDDINNLLTSCFDCNRGKKDIPLDVLPASVSNTIKTLKEQKKQTRIYYKYVEDMHNETEKIINELGYYFFNKFQKTKRTHDKYIFGDKWKISIKYFLKTFNKYQIIEAMNMSIDNLKRKNRCTEGNVFSYMCGILHNWKKQRCQTGS
ncbi:MAG TPA: HNH endonuclease [Pricia antarctica]|uniref:HNH endonuclease n=1 Tax=Pricia antarctica TaxID=641691 RepID=A0A831VVI8_9FLAO|nr:HNH endonuclease [Pricia antarctica]